MKVVYQTLMLLFVLSCSHDSVYKISHKHLERTGDFYVSLGIWVFGEFWVEVLDDTQTSFPFDEAVWKNLKDGAIHYIDVVHKDGSIYRSGWDWKHKRFGEFNILEFEGANMTPWLYIYILLEQKKVPLSTYQ